MNWSIFSFVYLLIMGRAGNVMTSKGAIRLPCGTIRHIYSGETFIFDNAAIFRQPLRSVTVRELPMSTLRVPGIITTSHRNEQIPMKVPLLSGNLDSSKTSDYNQDRKNSPEICHWTFTSSPTCQVKVHMAYYRLGDPRCSKQYLLLSDNINQFRLCGSYIPLYVLRLANQELSIKYFRKPFTYRTLFKGYVSCEENGPVQPPYTVPIQMDQDQEVQSDLETDYFSHHTSSNIPIADVDEPNGYSNSSDVSSTSSNQVEENLLTLLDRLASSYTIPNNQSIIGQTNVQSTSYPVINVLETPAILSNTTTGVMETVDLTEHPLASSLELSSSIQKQYSYEAKTKIKEQTFESFIQYENSTNQLYKFGTPLVYNLTNTTDNAELYQKANASIGPYYVSKMSEPIANMDSVNQNSIQFNMTSKDGGGSQILETTESSNPTPTYLTSSKLIETEISNATNGLKQIDKYLKVNVENRVLVTKLSNLTNSPTVISILNAHEGHPVTYSSAEHNSTAVTTTINSSRTFSVYTEKPSLEGRFARIFDGRKLSSTSSSLQSEHNSSGYSLFYGPVHSPRGSMLIIPQEKSHEANINNRIPQSNVVIPFEIPVGHITSLSKTQTVSWSSHTRSFSTQISQSRFVSKTDRSSNHLM